MIVIQTISEWTWRKNNYNFAVLSFPSAKGSQVVKKMIEIW